MRFDKYIAGLYPLKREARKVDRKFSIVSNSSDKVLLDLARNLLPDDVGI